MTQSLVNKRQSLAARMVVQAQALDEAISVLVGLQAERLALAQDFQDSDFDTGIGILVDGVTVRIDHLDAYTVGSLFDFGLTPLKAAYTTGTPTPQSIFLKARQ